MADNSIDTIACATIRYNTHCEKLEAKWYSNGTLTKTKKYLGDYEIKIAGADTTKYCYIYSPVGLTAILIHKGNTDSLFYVCTDHLGSITALVKENGAIAEDTAMMLGDGSVTLITGIATPRQLMEGLTEDFAPMSNCGNLLLLI